MRQMTIRDVQMVLLDIMQDVHDFCVKNDIKYSLSGGTLLGAERHGGFIPWDDDADLQMARPEYDRFIRTYKSEKGYKLFSREIEGGENVRIRITKICDMKRTWMDNTRYPWTPEETGIGLDIIPVDGAPSTLEEAKKYMKGLKKWARVTKLWRNKFIPFSQIKRYGSRRGKLRFLKRKVLAFFIPNSCIMGYINYQKQYDFDSSDHFCAGPHYGLREWQPKEYMKDFVLHKYEDREFYVMSGYKENLRSNFGENYMELPPEKKRKAHSYYGYYWID